MSQWDDRADRVSEDFERRAARQADKFAAHPKWYLGSRFLAVVGVLVALSVVGAVGDYAFSWWAAPWQGKLAARKIIQGDGNYRIVAYDSFFNQCASVQTLDNNIATQQTLLAQFEQGSSDYNRTLTNIAGLESARADAINQYNADASKSYTIGQFKSSHLPYQLPTGAYQKGEHITCAS